MMSVERGEMCTLRQCEDLGVEISSHPGIWIKVCLITISEEQSVILYPVIKALWVFL